MSIPTFVDWTSKQLALQGKALTRPQVVLLAVAFDGYQPETFAHVPETQTLFGEVTRIPPQSRRIVCALIGARSGKSFLLGAARATYCALFGDLSKLAAGEQASAVIVAPDLKLARQTLRYVRGFTLPEGYEKTETADCVEIHRPDGQTVRVEILAASVGGRSLKGRWYVYGCLDELAHFYSRDTGEVCDEDIADAIQARLLPGAQIVFSSTPWLRQGLHHDTFRRNRDQARDAIAAFCPTATMRPDDAYLQEYIEQVRQRRPDVASREYDCQYIEADARSYFDPIVVQACVGRVPPGKPTRFSIGADFAHVRDSLAVVVCAEPGPQVVELLEWQPKAGAPLSYRTIVPAICELAVRYHCHTVYCDHFEIYSVNEHATRGVRFEALPGGQNAKADQYSATRELLSGLCIPERFESIARQLKTIRDEPQPGGGLKITAPRRAGQHGDQASALVAALYPLRPTHAQYFEALRGLHEFLSQPPDPHAHLRGPWW